MADAPVRMRVEWLVPAGRAPQVVEALQSLMASTRRQVGCLACAASTEAGEFVKFEYQGTWETE